MTGLILNICLAYLIWWAISRGSLLAAWLYSKPGTFKARHWVFITLSAVPGVQEVISSILVIFSIAFGIDPRRANDH